MTLATRTGLAALVAAVLSVVTLAGVGVVQYETNLRERVDAQLVERAESAAVLAAVGDRLAVSELNATVDGARVVTDSGVVLVGRLPDEPLPSVTQPGWRTTAADGEDWRLYAVQVVDVPRPGDVALVEFAAPLGDVNQQLQVIRRRTLAAGFAASMAAGLIGWLLGRRATRPLSRLRDHAAAIGTPHEQHIDPSYGSREVDGLAAALSTSLHRLAVETERREDALDAARSFAASASHELRTPLQSAMTNLDVALAADPGATAPIATSLRTARTELARMGSALAGVSALADAELIDAAQFEHADLADIVDAACASVTTAAAQATGVGDVVVSQQGDDNAPATVWSDGVRLAVDNLLRNALVHGRPVDGSAPRLVVTVDAAARSISVDDNGPGIAADDRERVVRAYERGATDVPGSGLGLAFVARVAAAHGGRLIISSSPLGGARLTVDFPGTRP